jgi:REP element-mobilizing transposase RayT
MNCRLQHTDASRIAKECWLSLPSFYPNIKLDEFVIMPNHVHFVILITDDSCVDKGNPGVNKSISYRMKRRKMLISKIIGRFKMQTAKQINIIHHRQGQPFWQKNYYDHIVRNEPELERIRGYIRYNPLRWEKDRDNPPGIFI